MADIEETRIAPRKLIRSRAKVGLENGPTLSGRTVDISMTGICVMVDGPINPGHVCMIAFEATVQGKPMMVTVMAKTVYSICGRDGFRTGFQFMKVKPETNAILANLLA